MTPPRNPTVVTIQIAENPMAGLPGQNDLTITVSSEPDMEFREGQPLPDPDDVPLAVVAAIECLHHLTGLTHEAAFVMVAKGSEN